MMKGENKFGNNAYKNKCDKSLKTQYTQYIRILYLMVDVFICKLSTQIGVGVDSNAITSAPSSSSVSTSISTQTETQTQIQNSNSIVVACGGDTRQFNWNYMGIMLQQLDY